MLSYVLSFVVALGSFTFFMKGFFYPSLHRRNDFLWSGVGLFYALVLWVCAEQMRGAILLGQSASVTLLGWASWQILTLRWQTLPGSQKSQMPDPTLIPVILQEPFKPLKGRELPEDILIDPQPSPSSSIGDLEKGSLEQPPAGISEDLSASVLAPKPIASSPSRTRTTPVSPSTPPRTRQKGQLNLSPTVLKEVAQSLQAGAQQILQNVTGKKPKRTTIVIQRPSAPVPAGQQPEIEVDELDLLNNTVEPPPHVMEDLVEPIAFTSTGEVEAVDPASELSPIPDPEDPEFEDLPTP